MDNRIFEAYQSESNMSYPVGLAPVETRSRFVVKTYLNLFFAVLAFAVAEIALFAIVGVAPIVQFISANSKVVALGLLALCLVGPMVGAAIVRATSSRLAQYGLLAFYVLMYVLMFVPIFGYAIIATGGSAIILQAAGLTAALFAALSSAVFLTRKDFSFLRTGLTFAAIASIVVIVAAMIFGFNLGFWFSALMVLLACGYILYDTSNVMLHYPEDGDVLAAVSLFASVMMLFYYILRILGSMRR